MIHAETLGILAPAFAAGVLVLITHIPLGMQVLRRGIVFIDLAIAQIAALGVIAAGIFMPEPANWLVQLTATLSALLGAALLAWMEKRWPDVQEAQIGAVFVLAATGGLLLLAGNPHGGEHLRDLLAGQILWVSPGQLLVPGLLTLALITAIAAFRAQLPSALFYPVFALAITVSVQLVGVYLVFASLILPALGSRRRQGWQRLIWAGGIGLAGYAGGLWLSLLFDLPAGAIIVWMIALLGIAALMLNPKNCA